MDMDIAHKIMQWNANTEDKEVLEEFLLESKKAYSDEIKKISLDDDDKIYFAWLQSYIHIYLIRISDSMNFNQIVVMATKVENDSKNEITYIDKTQETDNGHFIHSNEDQKLSMLFDTYDLKKVINPEAVIKKSVYFMSVGSSPELWINRWVDREMEHTKKHFSLPPIDLRFNNLGLHTQKFKLNQIIKAVNDEQFNRELEECMTVFEEEYYYPAAAGLGGIMESLLYKTLENYQRTSHKILGSDPTLLDYLGALKRFNLIDRRQSNRIRASFTIRNSISHYNQGFTEVSDIETMLHGIENIFTTLYLPSQEWKEAHPNEQLPEPNHRN